MKIYLVLFFVISSLVKTNEKERYKDIESAYKENLHIDVIKDGEHFLREYPSSTYANQMYLYLGISYREQNNFERSLSYFRKLIKSNLKTRAIFEEALTYIKWEKFNEAKQKISQLNDIYSSQANFHLAKAYYLKNNFNESKRLFKKIVEERTFKYEEAISTLGLIAYKEKNYLDAISYFESFILESENMDNDKKDSINFKIAMSYYSLGLYREALEKHNEILKNRNSLLKKSIFMNTIEIFNKQKDSQNLDKYFIQALKYFRENKRIEDLKEFAAFLSDEKLKLYNKSIDVYKELIKLKIPVEIELATLYWNLERYEEVINILKNKENIEAIDLVVHSLYELDKYENVIAYEEKINNSNNIELLLTLAKSYYFLENYKKSFDVFQKSYKKDSNNNKESLSGIIISLSKLNDEKVITYFNEYKLKFDNDKEYLKDIYKAVANYYLKNNKKVENEQILKELIKKDRSDDSLKTLMAALIDNNKYKDIFGYAAQFTKEEDKFLFEAIAHMNLHNYKEAKLILEKLYKKNRKDLRVYEYLLECLFSLGEYSESISLVNNYLKLNDNSLYIISLDKKALSYFKLNKYNEAIATYEEMYKKSDSKDYALFKIGELNYNIKKYNLAFSSYKKLINSFPESSYLEKATYSAITSLYLMKNIDELLELAEIFLANYPNSLNREDVYLYLGESYLSRKEFIKALANYENFLAISKDSSRKESLISYLTNIFIDEKKYEYAKRFASKIAEASKRNLYLARIAEATGKTEDALNLYNQAVEKGDDEASYFLANYHFKKNDFDKAADLYREIVKVKTNKYRNDSLFKLALIYEKKEDFKKAIINLNFLKYLYIEIENQEKVYLKLAELYEKIKENINAAKTYEEFINKFKASKWRANVLEKLIIYHLNKGNKSLAKRYYMEVKKLNENIAKKYEENFENN